MSKIEVSAEKRLITALKAYVRRNLKTPVINKATGFPIEVSVNGIEHSMKYELFTEKKGNAIPLAKFVLKFKTVFRDMVYEGAEPDKKQRDGIIAIHVFSYKSTWGDIEIIVREIVGDRKIMKNKNLFYNHKFKIE